MRASGGADAGCSGSDGGLPLRVMQFRLAVCSAHYTNKNTDVGSTENDSTLLLLDPVIRQYPYHYCIAMIYQSLNPSCETAAGAWR